MNQKWRRILSIGVVLLVGLTVLAGYLFPSQLGPILTLVFEWGLVLVAVTGLIGIGYLVAMHIRRLVWREKDWFYSVVLLVAFLLSGVGGFVLTTDSPFYRDLILNVQVPVEASLLAILAATLLYASLRLIRVRGWTPMSIAFLVSAIFSLLLNIGLFRTTAGTLGDAVLAFFKRLPLVGARGVLLGMALGGMLVGLRYLFSLDRTDGGQ
ncbi:hypothetical protein KQH50_03330 [bacterium]|nr:hypothetical protein [bacterium]